MLLDGLRGGLNQSSKVSVYDWLVPSVYSIVPFPDSSVVSVPNWVPMVDAPRKVSCVADDEAGIRIVCPLARTLSGAPAGTFGQFRVVEPTLSVAPGASPAAVSACSE